MSLIVGARVGPFDVLSPLGAGGMGEVWRARDSRLGREVALKVLPTAFANDRERMVRFQREAQLLAAFNHQNIAAIYSFENVDGVQLLVMEMVPGDTVKQLLLQGPLSLSRALAIARQTAEALDAAHGKGILHRDLKPANVKVTPDGKVKLLDFGLAKAFGPGPNVSDISESPTLDTGATRQGMVLGTVPYMSPEQARGRTLDWRSDVWSFGCLLFEMLSGKRAFGGASPSDILVAILEREPDWTALPKETPPGILSLLEECLTKDPDKRAPDMAHVRQQLDLALEGKALFVATSSMGVSARIRSAPRVWATAGALLAVAVAVLVYVTLRGKDTTALPAAKLLAILPATDLTGRADGRQLCDGVSFSLGVKLQNVPGIAIMRPSAPAMLKETDPAKWARDTGANLLIQPAVRQVGDTRQLSFSVFLAGSPLQVASGEVTGPAGEHFRLEEELTQHLVAALRLHLASGAPVPTPVTPSLAPGPAQTDYVVALGYLERRDKPESVQKAVELLTEIPDGGKSDRVQAALGRAYLYLYNLDSDTRHAELARQAALKATSLDPNSPEAQVALGQILTATGEPKKAVEVIRRVLEGHPNDFEAVLALARALQSSGEDSEAEQAFLRATGLRPTSWSARNLLAAFYARKGRNAEALAAFQKAAALNPDVAPVQQNIGAILVKLGRFDDAVNALSHFIEIQPTPQAYSNLGVSYYLLGRYGEAARAFGQAAALAPKNFHFLLYQGDALRWTPGRSAEAQAAYQRALPLGEATLSVNPNDPSELALVAQCRARLGQNERAWIETQHAVSLSPDDIDVLQTAAVTAAALGRLPESLDFLSRAAERGLGSGEITRDPNLRDVRSLPEFPRVLSIISSKKKTS
ncbi:MAG: protein kinase [Thermoanaerobaculia bacterium]